MTLDKIEWGTRAGTLRNLYPKAPDNQELKSVLVNVLKIFKFNSLSWAGYA
jgi:hypothetical protein